MHRQTALKTVDALVAEEFLPADVGDQLAGIESQYAIAVPPHLADLIDRSNPEDPIALQVIPHPKEMIVRPDEYADPIGDESYSPLKGLVHRYPDRVLLKLHSACSVYCRFCFRREMVGPGGETMSATDLDAAYAYIKDNTNIWEVILTGGDPLLINERRLKDVLDKLVAIDHVAVIRLHTRLPVAAPERITQQLVSVLSNQRATVYVAVHTNHERELTDDAIAACNRITQAGIPLLGQTVLLKGVNDDAITLDALFRKMVSARITPYYLHHLDLAPGTSHFRVSLERGQAIIKALRGRLSGIAHPTYMLDIPGGFGKVPVGPTYPEIQKDGAAIIEDVHGRKHIYPPETPDGKA